MTIPEAYKKIKPSIVAICSRVSSNSYFPDIIGTGFIIEKSGLILTNQHIIKAIRSLPRRKNAPVDEWPVFCFLFHFIPGKGMAQIPLEIKAVGGVGAYSQENYYGDLPDVGIIRVNVSGLPTAVMARKFELEEGEQVGISGFPMGTRTLQAPGWIHQVSPTLKIGNVAAVLPFPCENPHAILIDSMMQGGNSGSPVFNKIGEVVGILYGGIDEKYLLKNTNNPSKILVYNVPSNLSLAIPCQLLNSIIEGAKKNPVFKEHTFKTITLQQVLNEHEAKILTPKAPLDQLIPIPENEIEGLSVTVDSLKNRR